MHTTSANAPAAIPAGCKINLYLYITARRDDGYHELNTLFLPLPRPSDVLRVTPGQPGGGLAFSCSDPGLAGSGNLVAKAYAAFAAATGFAPDLSVHLEKKSPVGAGLGGGSADCAAMLKHLNALAAEKAPRGAALEAAALAALAKSLGADVPFFLAGVPATATGIGEQLTPVEVDLAGASLLLLTPKVQVNTAWAYRAYDEAFFPYGPGRGSPRRSSFLTGPAETVSSPIRPLGMALANDFERVVLPAFPELAGLKEELAAAGAAQAVLSGSGAAMFGLFAGREAAEAAKRRFAMRQVPAYVFHY